MNIIVSACLLGRPCKYNGSDNYDKAVADLAEKHNLIPVCPEMLGGLPCPRTPCEIAGESVLAKDGTDCTREYQLGAQKALQIALDAQADLCVVQPRSPSCGCGRIYDGSFSGKLIEGDGVFVRLLKRNSLQVISSESLRSCTLSDNELECDHKVSGGKSK